MKKIILLIAIVATSMASAQKYFTKTGLTEFKASVEAFEPVEAKNESTTAILNTETGDIAALLFVKAFHFEIALMEEHFNENYMDSDKFPKATFKGMLTVRGKTKSIESIVQIKNTDGKIVLSSEFSVSPKDFDIEIPSIVRKKIAESIYIKFCYELIEKK